MQKTMILQLACLLLFSISWTALARPGNEFVECLEQYSDNSSAISQVIYTPNNASFQQILDSRKHNLRFSPMPLVIITPNHESQIQTAIYCSKKHGLQMRMRSGGHDSEGVSYVSKVPFFILDMSNFRSISVDAQSRTAWVGVGATLGEFYFAINKIDGSFFLPAGSCPTVGVGGHVSGGGYGIFSRKYGIAADHVIDARVIDANGRILDRKTMGEDFFWAIRGGTGASFGVILSYKVKLLEIRPNITASTITRTLDQNTLELVHRWQYVAPKITKDLSIILRFTTVNSNQTGKSDVQVTFFSFFIGEVDGLVSLMEEYFPELGVSKEDCIEISWVENFAIQSGVPLELAREFLQNRTNPILSFHKDKSDLFQQPIPKTGLAEIFNLFTQRNPGEATMEWNPFGGRMEEIPESNVPFPYRAGTLFLAVEVALWNGKNKTLAEEGINWNRKLYQVIGKYVANNQRSAYANYRDLDLGTNNRKGYTSVEKARAWGTQYYKNNFDRLVKVKTMVDPKNFFRFEQSIPPYRRHA
jgi:FAD/FMN-containing dehydrogenase